MNVSARRHSIEITPMKFLTRILIRAVYVHMLTHGLICQETILNITECRHYLKSQCWIKLRVYTLIPSTWPLILPSKIIFVLVNIHKIWKAISWIANPILGMFVHTVIPNSHEVNVNYFGIFANCGHVVCSRLTSGKH